MWGQEPAGVLGQVIPNTPANQHDRQRACGCDVGNGERTTLPISRNLILLFKALPAVVVNDEEQGGLQGRCPVESRAWS